MKNTKYYFVEQPSLLDLKLFFCIANRRDSKEKD